jgi:Uma2 family endonuclease
MITPTLSRVEPSNGYPDTLPEEQCMPNPGWHAFLLGLVLQALRWHFREEENVSIEGDMLIFYEGGRHDLSVAPDVFIVRGPERRWRRNWLTWQEGTPQLVIELVSESTRARDTGEKFRLYRDVLKVSEYFLFDPEGHLLRPRLQGFRLTGGEYAPIEPVEGRLPSKFLGLHLEQHGDELRFWDPTDGVWVPTDAERASAELARADQEAARADQEAARADAAERRARELEAELARLRGGS